jgi:Spx/MgsR family transcriptional regulator
MIKIYGIKNCDSVKKALKYFEGHNVEYELFDFKKEQITCDMLERWLKNTDIQTLFNSKSTTYRNLNLKELNLDDEQKAQWLCKENLLIKRPVIEHNNGLLVGFNEETYNGVFL